MSDLSLFKWRYFQADIILCAVWWCLRYAVSDRDVEEHLRERSMRVDHTTLFGVVKFTFRFCHKFFFGMSLVYDRLLR